MGHLTKEDSYGSRWKWGALVAALLLVIAGALFVVQQIELLKARAVAVLNADRALQADVERRVDRLCSLIGWSYAFSLAVLGVALFRGRRAVHQRMEETHALRLSESLHRAVVGALNDGLLVFDAAGRVQACNPSAERMLRRSFAEMKVNNLADWSSIDERGEPIPTAELPVAIALTQGIAQRHVVLGDVDPNGTVTWLDVSVEPLRDAADGALTGAVVSFTDITERKRVEAELARYRDHLEDLVNARTEELKLALAAREESENFAQAITENQPTLIAYVGPALTIEFANRAFLEWFGKTREEITGKPAVETLGPEVLRGREDMFERLRAGEKGAMALEVQGASGELGHFWTHRVPDVRDGKFRGYYLIATNVTELRHAERRQKLLNQALAEAEAFTRKIADSIPARIGYWDTQTRIRFLNKNYCDYFQKPFEELAGRTILELLGEKRFSAAEARIQAALLGEPQRFELPDALPDGTQRVSEVHFIPDLRNGEVRGCFTLSLDVTQTRADQRALELLNAELVEARDKAQSAARVKSAFLSNMSHEIRTPMNAIIGLTHLLRRDSPAPAAAERLERVAGAAQQLMEMIDNVLDLSRAEADQVAPDAVDFSPATLLENLRSRVAVEASAKGLDLRIEVNSLPPTLRGDAARLSRAIGNLLSNAVKFTERGTITLRARIVETRGNELQVRFEVCDTGIGLTPEELERVFEAFGQVDSSTTRRFGGTGLGLDSTRRLVRLLGGDLSAESAPGQGSTFWICVPLQTPPTVASAEDEAAAFDPPQVTERDLRALHAGARVLLAEDNPVNQEVAAALLRDAGLVVDVAANGHEVIARTDATRYALILMDIQMPGLDGLQATRIVRSRGAHPEVPIVAMTAHANAEDRAACLAAGMNDHITKPVDPAVLYAAVGRWLAPTPVDSLDPPVPAARTALDTQRGLAFFGRKQKVYARALRQFGDLYAGGIEGSAAYAQGPSEAHAKALRRELHSIEGAAAALGAKNFADRLQAISCAIHDAPFDESTIDEVVSMGGELHRLIDDMRVAARQFDPET